MCALGQASRVFTPVAREQRCQRTAITAGPEPIALVAGGRRPREAIRRWSSRPWRWVCPQGRIVVGIKLSDREHTAVMVDFAGNLMADVVIPRKPGRCGA